MTQRLCALCGQTSPESARFCVNCGRPFDRVRGRIQGYTKRAQFASKGLIENIKNRIDIQLGSILNDLEKPGKAQIAGIKIPENKRGSIINAIQSFQSKYGSDQNTKEFEAWMQTLPDMIGDQKCLVCFGKWKPSDDIVVCRYCQSGGHREHMYNWMDTNNLCPLCRRTIRRMDLLTVSIVDQS